MSHQEPEYNRGGLIAFIFAFSFVFIFFFYISFVHKGVILDTAESQKDKAATPKVEKTESPAAAAFDVSAVKEPWVETPDMIAAGGKIFANTCAMCHGDAGMGDGVAGKSLNPPPRNFVEGKWKVGGSRAKLFQTVSNGISGSSMASFGHLPENDRWALVHFVRSITKNKVGNDDDELKKFLSEKK